MGNRIQTSAVVFEGASWINGEPILAIVTGILNKSQNAKTGAMAQLWILPKASKPTDASKAGEDSAVCGECPLRWNTGGACYVNLGQAPNGVYKAWQAGNTAPANTATLEYLASIPLRFGAYGDPLAIPPSVLKSLLKNRDKQPTTAYSYQWRNPDNQWARSFVMASCHNFEDLEQATALGWSTFRVKAPEDSFRGDEIECLATAQSIQCVDCGLCNGGTAKRQRHIYIDVHGSRSKRFAI
jgi:hypothetical protein